MTTAAHWRARLLALDVCAISDALDQLRLPSAISGIASRTVRKRIAGRVVTVRLAAGAPPADAHVRHLGTTAIEQAEPGDIIVVEQATGIDCAGWGGILSNAAMAKGIAGTIVEGPARDIDEATELGYPLFARAATPRTARDRIHEAETGGAITVGGLAVRSGDWVCADATGMAFIPADAIEQVVIAAELIARREALMTREVLDGKPVSQVMGANYEHMLSQSVEGQS